MDLAASLRPQGYEFLFVGLGPQPSVHQEKEASELGRLHWLQAPLDWMVKSEDDLSLVGPAIANLAHAEAVDLLHLNLPSQAAAIETKLPVIVMSHSCVVTWFAGVRREAVPLDWQWHHKINRCGLMRADVALAPSRSHARMLENAYGAMDRLHVVYNASRSQETSQIKDRIVCAAARWWDDGKNGQTLDEAAALTAWPIMIAGPNTGPDGQTLPIRHAQHLGALSNAQVMALMGRSSIFASPSLYEPFGLAALEAARAHNALVLADIRPTANCGVKLPFSQTLEPPRPGQPGSIASARITICGHNWLTRLRSVRNASIFRLKPKPWRVSTHPCCDKNLSFLLRSKR